MSHGRRLDVKDVAWTSTRCRVLTGHELYFFPFHLTTDKHFRRFDEEYTKSNMAAWSRNFLWTGTFCMILTNWKLYMRSYMLKKNSYLYVINFIAFLFTLNNGLQWYGALPLRLHWWVCLHLFSWGCQSHPVHTGDTISSAILHSDTYSTISSVFSDL